MLCCRLHHRSTPGCLFICFSTPPDTDLTDGDEDEVELVVKNDAEAESAGDAITHAHHNLRHISMDPMMGIFHIGGTLTMITATPHGIHMRIMRSTRGQRPRATFRPHVTQNPCIPAVR